MKRVICSYEQHDMNLYGVIPFISTNLDWNRAKN